MNVSHTTIVLYFDLGRVLILAAKTRLLWRSWQDLSLKEMAVKPPVIPELFSGTTGFTILKVRQMWLGRSQQTEVASCAPDRKSLPSI